MACDGVTQTTDDGAGPDHATTIDLKLARDARAIATPLIDVVMCLIIFPAGRQAASDRGATVRLPDSLSGREEQAGFG